MNFDLANIKSVKADIGKGEITISFSVSLNSENLTEAECLRDYLATKVEAATEMTVDMYPHQMRLFPPLSGLKSAEIEINKDTELPDAPSGWQPETVDQPAEEAPF